MELIGSECTAAFNTYCFLVAFLPAVVAGFWLLPGRPAKMAWLTVSSLVFYGFWDVRFVGLLVGSALLDYAVALAMSRSTNRRRAWLMASLAANLGVLAVFKYAGFASDSARSLLELFGIDGAMPHIDIVLPVGISFYTFQTLSYTIDVYRGDVEATRNPLLYLCYVTMFAQLVAGPIVRYRDMAAQLANIGAPIPVANFVQGFFLFGQGLAKKVIVADGIAALIDPLWAEPGALGTAGAWAAALGYTVQLYFDFSGYSDMAIGIGAMLGLRYPINFNSPYRALDPSDFWRRWHISLSSWLRDYLYIPLGGSRQGPRRTQINLMLTMLLGGLWHGAAWTFVLWGAYHGLLLAAYRRWAAAWDQMPVSVRRFLMLFLVVLGWVLFKAPDFTTAAVLYRAMFGFGAPGAAPVGWALFVVACAIAFVFVWEPRRVPMQVVRRRHALLAGAAFALAVIFMNRADSPFLYYQF